MAETKPSYLLMMHSNTYTHTKKNIVKDDPRLSSVSEVSVIVCDLYESAWCMRN